MNQSKKGMESMKKRLGILWVLVISLIILLGCVGPSTETSKDQRIRCAKCAGYYDSEQGAHLFNWMQGPGDTRR
jgi:hypothetical protein